MVEQRFTFNRIAGDYDAYRPGYPEALFAALKAMAPPGARVLEVGCGTGKATEGLARCGFALTALDPGPQMLDQARARLAGVGEVRFEEGTFEGWRNAGEPFDLICAAQSWHWVDPVVGFAKAASSLKPGGALAIFGNRDLPGEGPLSDDLRQVFVDVFGKSQRDGPGAFYGAGGSLSQQFEASGLFGPIVHAAWRHEMAHTADSYAALVSTYSDVQMLEPARRQALLDGLRNAIERHGGQFVMGLEAAMHFARTPG